MGEFQETGQPDPETITDVPEILGPDQNIADQPQFNKLHTLFEKFGIKSKNPESEIAAVAVLIRATLIPEKQNTISKINPLFKNVKKVVEGENCKIFEAIRFVRLMRA